MTIKPEQFGAAGNQGTPAAGSEWGEQPMNVGNIERLVSILVGGSASSCSRAACLST